MKFASIVRTGSECLSKEHSDSVSDELPAVLRELEPFHDQLAASTCNWYGRVDGLMERLALTYWNPSLNIRSGFELNAASIAPRSTTVLTIRALPARSSAPMPAFGEFVPESRNGDARLGIG